MDKYYITTTSYSGQFYIKNDDGTPRSFTEDEANQFMKGKPYLLKVLIK